MSTEIKECKCYCHTPLIEWEHKKVETYLCAECEALLEKNNGYNPESLEDNWELGTLDEEDGENNKSKISLEEMKQEYLNGQGTLVESTSMKEYIEEYSGVCGYYFDGMFFTRD